MNHRIDSVPSVSEDGSLREIERLLHRRAERLRQRPGLAERVMGAIERELNAPVVIGRIEPSWRHRMAALAAVVVLLVLGFVAARLLRTEHSARESPIDLAAIAEAPIAERLLVALLEESQRDLPAARTPLIEQLIPGSAVQFDELDQELHAILGRAAGENGA